MSQTYGNWQLIIADGSTNESASKYIEQTAAADSRIKYLKLNKNLGISGNTNQAIPYIEGEYVGFLDHDDILSSWSLNEIALAIKNNPNADVFYSDEDRLTESGRVRISAFLKPDWSPDLFFSTNYIAHLSIISKKLLLKLKGLRPAYDGSQDYDLMLRALDNNLYIVHIPKILYHMRMAKGSTAKSIGEKNYAHEAGKNALKDYLRRNKIEAQVLEIKDHPTNYRIRYKLKGQPLVSIIIPFKDRTELLKDCIDSITEKTKYKNYELILISNGSSRKKTFDYLKSLESNKRICVYNYDRSFNYSAINNFGRRKAKGEILVFLNNDTKVISPEWLDELAASTQREEIGAVGALLMYPDNTIQHAGVILGLTGMAGHVFREVKLGTLTPFWLPDWPRNFLAVTGACLAVNAKKFDGVKGFNEKFIVAGSDVVLCLDLVKTGYRNLYWPFAKLMHYESKTVISYKNAPISDYDLSLKYYKPYLNYGDPYFNPNLSLESEAPIMRIRYE